MNVQTTIVCESKYQVTCVCVEVIVNTSQSAVVCLMQERESTIYKLCLDEPILMLAPSQ